MVNYSLLFYYIG